MYISELKSALPTLFKHRLTALIWGHFGIGKSSVMDQVAEEGGHMLINYRLGNVEAGELIGVLSESRDRLSSTNLKPDWLTELFAFCQANPDKYGILFLDELNHIRKDMQSFVFQMALDHKLHTWQFPKNLRVVCAANPPTEDYSGVFDFTNKALLSRFVHVKLAPSTEEWLSYARLNSVNDDVQAFITDHQEVLDTDLQAFAIDDFANRSRRSWERAALLHGEGAPRELIMGILGVASTVQFYDWLAKNKEKPITADMILEDYLPTKKSKKNTELRDKVLKLKETGKIGQLNTICAAICEKIGALPDEAFSKRSHGSDCIAAFSLDLPAEVAWSFMSVLIFKPALHYGPDEKSGKEPGSVFGPHNYPELLEVFTKYKSMGVADKVKEEAVAK